MTSQTKRFVQVRYGGQHYIVGQSVLDAPGVRRHYLNWAASCEVQSMANGGEEDIRIADQLVGPQIAHYKRLLDDAVIAEIEGSGEEPVVIPEWRKPVPDGVPLPPGRSTILVNKTSDVSVIVLSDRVSAANTPVRDGIDFLRGVLIAAVVAVVAFAAMWALRGWVGGAL